MSLWLLAHGRTDQSPGSTLDRYVLVAQIVASTTPTRRWLQPDGTLGDAVPTPPLVSIPIAPDQFWIWCTRVPEPGKYAVYLRLVPDPIADPTDWEVIVASSDESSSPDDAAIADRVAKAITDKVGLLVAARLENAARFLGTSGLP